MAFLRNQEPAASLVNRIWLDTRSGRSRVAINIMNMGEVYYLCVKEKNLAYGESTLAMLRDSVDVVSALDHLVMMAAGLKARYAISYADGFAAATAIQAKAPLVTGDGELKAVATREKNLTLRWIGA